MEQMRERSRQFFVILSRDKTRRPQPRLLTLSSFQSSIRSKLRRTIVY